MQTSNTIKNTFSPKFPNFPIQDQFGQLVVNLGIAKIEDAVIQIATGIVSNSVAYGSGALLPETIAEESYNIAIACFEKIHEEYVKMSATGGSSSIITECPPPGKL